MSILRNTIAFCLLIIFIIFTTASNLYAYGESFRLASSAFNPNQPDESVEFGFYPSGYSDGWYWGYSNRHQYGRHEMLSGEWAAAIYYDGIHNNKSNWITSHFEYPTWNPDTCFQADSYPNDWTPRIEANSILHDPNIRVTIDYKLIDLGINGYASLPYYPQGSSAVATVRSERYILIQTYNIKNIRDINVTGVRLYQMLVGLVESPFRDISKSSIYSDANVLHLLPGSYDPCNPNSPPSFRYCVTQWNSGAPHVDHVDWVTFASTIQPNWIENGIYDWGGSGGDSTPGYTSYDIKYCNLNGITNIYNTDSPAGAMGWDLGTLTPGQTKSITVAVMFGTTNWPCQAILTKDDNIPDGDCVLPASPITYTIHYDANGLADTNVSVIDYLPDEVDYNWSSSGGNYNPDTRRVIWNLGTVSGGYSGNFTLIVNANNLAEPCGVITNRCEVVGDFTYKYAELHTPVCWWCPQNNIIYVNDDAFGGDTGMSWENAYRDLQTALDRASLACASQIWVAAGTYIPSVPSGSPTFQILDNVSLYGHFAGNETSVEQRNLDDPNSETILDGTSAYATYVVTASGLSQNNILDGFTITGVSYAGVRIENAKLIARNCLITGAGQSYGISAVGSNFTAEDTVVQNSNYDGISANNSSFTINRCTIQDNYSNGIYTYESSYAINECVIQNNSRGIYSYFNVNGGLPETRITNSIISNNTLSEGIYLDYLSSPVVLANNLVYGNGTYGISVSSMTPGVTIRNNTIVNNNNYGIYLYCNSLPAPAISNCIVWGHNTEIYSNVTVTYSCVEGGYGNPPSTNIQSDPCFVDPDANDFHLKPESLCIDAGDPSFNDFNDKDIDGEPRIMFGKTAMRVDIGADELFWPKADYNRDEIVNFIDFASFAKKWLMTDANISLDADSDVDIDDLKLFCVDWLWIAPWSSLYEMYANQSYNENTETLIETGPPQAEQIGLSENMGMTAVSAEKPVTVEQPAVEPLTIEQMVDWLDGIWQAGESGLSEEDYLEFRAKIQTPPE